MKSHTNIEAKQIRAIAFYLPQYHAIPENDEWWGKGFTEWRNVAKARPLFPGHYQPHLPADLGFYDLRLTEVREAQADLAREYGLHGFCYYHYWFNGRRILERPFNEVLASGKPDFPFCLCWANENWTRAWDGGEREALLEQNYSFEDDLAHIRALIPAFRDPRYIRVDGKPLFLVYRTEHLPNPQRTAEIWRNEAMRAGIGEIYLARVESFVGETSPQSVGFDAAVEFAPDWRTLDSFLFRSPMFLQAIKWGLLPQLYQQQSITTYERLVRRMLAKPDVPYVRFRCATPGFDNSARRTEKGAAVYVGSTPERYGQWLSSLVQKTITHRAGDERIVFINAWNEWGEGNHLEPDRRFGLGFLEATRQALAILPVLSVADSESLIQPHITHASLWKQRYWKLKSALEELRVVYRHTHYWRSRGYDED